MREFNLLIISPDKICINKKVIQATFYTNNGCTTILPNHAKIVGYLSPGVITIKYLSGEKQKLLQNYGLFYFENNKLSITSDYVNFLNDSHNLETLNHIQEVINIQTNNESCSNDIVTILNSLTKKVIKCIKNNNDIK